MKKIGIYIHIPFCKSKCYYCDFTSYCNEQVLASDYIQCMEKEIEFKAIQTKQFAKKNNEEIKIDTIYIGGGTPSFIASKSITRIVNNIKKHFSIDCNAEITIEVNPDSVSLEKLEEYKKLGINRISIGLQSTHNELLKKIGRPHNFEQFKIAYNLVKNVGFNNINVDLMIGLPNQSMKKLEESLEEVIKLKPNHISIYSLILEEGTKLEKKAQNGELDLPSEELERRMYWFVKKRLEKEKYLHYEISNFAKEGMESKHNVHCWNQNEYLGMGVAAHSYFNCIRFSNTTNIKEYIENIKEGQYQRSQIIHEILSLEERKKEFMLLGLRKINGVEIKEFKKTFSQNPIYLFREQINKLHKKNLIEIDGDFIKLTDKGLDLANLVWEQFV